MPKKIKKEKHIKIIPFLITFIVLSLIGLFIFIICRLPIKNIIIEGNSYLSDQEVLEIAKLDNYPSFILTKSSKIKKRLKKNEIIKNVKVDKKIWGKVTLKIDEYKILFRNSENDYKVVLSNGKMIEDKGYTYNVPKLLNYVPDTKFDEFITAMNKINNDILVQISELTYVPNEQDSDRFLLYMNDGNYIYLTLTKFKQINYYEDVLKTLEGKKGILYLDSGNHFQIMG